MRIEGLQGLGSTYQAKTSPGRRNADHAKRIQDPQQEPGVPKPWKPKPQTSNYSFHMGHIQAGF